MNTINTFTDWTAFTSLKTENFESAETESKDDAQFASLLNALSAVLPNNPAVVPVTKDVEAPEILANAVQPTAFSVANPAKEVALRPENIKNDETRFSEKLLTETPVGGKKEAEAFEIREDFGKSDFAQVKDFPVFNPRRREIPTESAGDHKSPKLPPLLPPETKKTPELRGKIVVLETSERPRTILPPLLRFESSGKTPTVNFSLSDFRLKKLVNAVKSEKAGSFASSDINKMEDTPELKPNLLTGNTDSLEEASQSLIPKTVSASKIQFAVESENAESFVLPVKEKKTEINFKVLFAEQKSTFDSSANQTKFEPTNSDKPLTNQVLSGFDEILQEKFLSRKEPQTVRLRLRPDELGTVEIHLESAKNSGALHAKLVAENDQTRQILEQNLPHLQESLQNAGWQIERLEVVSDASLANSGFSFSQSNSQPQTPMETPRQSSRESLSSPMNEAENAISERTDKLLSVLA